MSRYQNLTKVQTRVICFDVVVFAERDIERLLAIHVEIAKANGAATIFVGVPPIEQGNNGLALWSDDFCRPNLISLANALS